MELSILNVTVLECEYSLHNHILSFCYGDKLCHVCKYGRIEIALETLDVSLVEHEIVHDRFTYHNFDSIKGYDFDERYIYILRRIYGSYSHGDQAKALELMCFDKECMQLFLLRGVADDFHDWYEDIKGGLDDVLDVRCCDLAYHKIKHKLLIWGLEDNDTRAHFQIDFEPLI